VLFIASALRRFGEYTVAELHRAYREEAAWRSAHIGKRLGEFEQRKYARYLDAEGRLSRAAAFEHVAYETIRTWYERLPDVLKVMARARGRKPTPIPRRSFLTAT
jgi:hypothetical protein